MDALDTLDNLDNLDNLDTLDNLDNLNNLDNLVTLDIFDIFDTFENLIFTHLCTHFVLVDANRPLLWPFFVIFLIVSLRPCLDKVDVSG